MSTLLAVDGPEIGVACRGVDRRLKAEIILDRGGTGGGNASVREGAEPGGRSVEEGGVNDGAPCARSCGTAVVVCLSVGDR